MIARHIGHNGTLRLGQADEGGGVEQIKRMFMMLGRADEVADVVQHRGDFQ